MTKVQAKKVKGGVALSITCDDCGEPLTKTNREFGMDCKNDCARKAFEASGGPAKLADLMGIISSRFPDAK